MGWISAALYALALGFKALDEGDLFMAGAMLIGSVVAMLNAAMDASKDRRERA